MGGMEQDNGMGWGWMECQTSGEFSLSVGRDCVYSLTQRGNYLDVSQGKTRFWVHLGLLGQGTYCTCRRFLPSSAVHLYGLSLPNLEPAHAVFGCHFPPIQPTNNVEVLAWTAQDRVHQCTFLSRGGMTSPSQSPPRNQRFSYPRALQGLLHARMYVQHGCGLYGTASADVMPLHPCR